MIGRLPLNGAMWGSSARYIRHRHPWEEILLVKDGDFEVSVNGRKQHAGPGAMVFLASNEY
jgi:quercetin dioxygenase-like cupin family protein